MTAAPLMSVAAAAEYLGLTEKALRRRVDRRAVPVKRLGLRTIRFDPRVLEAWMRESERYFERAARGAR